MTTALKSRFIVLLSIVLLVVAACGGSEPTDTTTVTAPTTTTTVAPTTTTTEAVTTTTSVAPTTTTTEATVPTTIVIDESRFIVPEGLSVPFDDLIEQLEIMFANAPFADLGVQLDASKSPEIILLVPDAAAEGELIYAAEIVMNESYLTFQQADGSVAFLLPVDMPEAAQAGVANLVEGTINLLVDPIPQSAKDQFALLQNSTALIDSGDVLVRVYLTDGTTDFSVVVVLSPSGTLKFEYNLWAYARGQLFTYLAGATN